MTASVTPAGRGRNPFDHSGVRRGDGGVPRYGGLPDSLVHLLRASVDREPGAPAVIEVGGDRLTYQELWDRAARVAGGLRAAGLERGDRAAIVLPNGLDWVLAFWGAQLAGAVAVPVNTRFKEPEVEYIVVDSGAASCVSCRPSAARRRPRGRGGSRARGSGGDLLYERHDRVSQGRDDHARQLPGQHRERGAVRGHRPRRGSGSGDVDQRSAVPCHGLQQPAAGHGRSGRPRVHLGRRA